MSFLNRRTTLLCLWSPNTAPSDGPTLLRCWKRTSRSGAVRASSAVSAGTTTWIQTSRSLPSTTKKRWSSSTPTRFTATSGPTLQNCSKEGKLSIFHLFFHHWDYPLTYLYDTDLTTASRTTTTRPFESTSAESTRAWSSARWPST